MANQFISNFTQLWNSAGTVYNAIKVNVTNAASAAASKLIDLQIGGVSFFNVSKAGDVTAKGAILPSANDNAALGASGTAWADLFLASGGVINWNAGNLTVTHSAAQLLMSGGTFVVSSGTSTFAAATAGLNFYYETDSGIASLGAMAGGTTSLAIGTSIAGVYGTRLTLTTTGGTQVAGALDVLGAFTSLGIDDNATGERVQIADTILSFGSVTAASVYNVERPIEDGQLSIYGGTASTATSGALWLYGASHATFPGGYALASGFDAKYRYDGAHIFKGTSLKPSANDGVSLGISGTAWSDAFFATGAVINFAAGDLTFTHSAGVMDYSQGTYRFGNASTNTPGSGNNLSGVAINAAATGVIYISGGGTPCLTVNRTADGNLVNLNSGGTNQGIISVAGATVTYGAFFGSHWSQLWNGVRMPILRGTIVETIDQMCEWPAFRYTDHDGAEHISEQVPAGLKPGEAFQHEYAIQVPEIEYYSEDVMILIEREREIDIPVTEDREIDINAVDVRDGVAVRVVRKETVKVQVFDTLPLVDEDGNPVYEESEPEEDEPRKPRIQRTHSVPRMQKVMETFQTPEAQTVERTRNVVRTVMRKVDATVFLQGEERLPCFEISDTPASRAVYGVFAWWEIFDAPEDDPDALPPTNDAFIGSLGAFVIRIAKGVTVQRGDYIESDGKGCGRVQSDDILRASTVAKITSATVVETYPDGSYLAPCTLHCG